MLIRHWDPEGHFEGAVLHANADWCLEVSWHQHTLGSFIIFCRRKGVRLVSDLADGELVSLRAEMRIIEEGLRKNAMFQPDHFNYWQMGNGMPLLHFHGMPRYREARQYNHDHEPQRTWQDTTWGHLPVWTRERISHELMVCLREDMRKFLTRDILP